jgi:hypothetical protein
VALFRAVKVFFSKLSQLHSGIFALSIFSDAQILDDAPEIIQNPFSGASIELDPQEIAIYDAIMGSTMMAEKMSTRGEHKQAERLYKDVRKGIDWFIKHNPKAYMVLLD